MIRLLLFLAVASASPGGLPTTNGLATVPGVNNVLVKQSNIHRTICVVGWASKQRALLGSRSTTLKRQVMVREHIDWAQSSQYELDHNAPIEVGGSPTDPNNLWLQPYFGPRNAHQKDKVEDLMHHMICDGKITLSSGRRQLESNWVATYEKYIGPLPSIPVSPVERGQ